MSARPGKKISGFVASAAEVESKVEGVKDASCAGNGEDIKAKTMSYSQRAELTTHPVAKRLLQLVDSKRTNLCLSADLSSPKQLLEMADKVGPHICVLKTHVDALDFDFGDAGVEGFIRDLCALANKHQFLLFEDRKYADIGSTVSRQFGGGAFRVSDWADLVNVHPLPGPGLLDALSQVNRKSACLLVAEMSSASNLVTPQYTQSAVQMAEARRDVVIGFVSQNKLTSDPNFIHFTPGVHACSKDDSKDQQYQTPSEVVEKGADVVIVGRGITQASDPVEAARLYAQESFAAHQRLVA